MKANYFVGNRQFELKELEIPSLGDDDILIRNEACGVCGSDVHSYYGEATSTSCKIPVVLGHELSGQVVEIGKQVTNVKVGDKVTIDPNIYCGSCRNCRTGKKQLCDNLFAIGVNRDGGFAEYCVSPAKQAFPLAKEMDYEVAAMSEPLACCIHGADLADIKSGDDVLIIGGGAIGQMMMQLAKLAGAANVLLSESVEYRRKVARELGADKTIDPVNSNIVDEIKAFTGRDGVDVVIECAGSISATRDAFTCASRGANIMLFSVPSGDDHYPLDRRELFSKELTIRSSLVNPDTHLRAVNLLSTGKVEVGPLITHRYGLAEVEEAIKMQMSNESIKVIVKPGS